MIQSWLLPTKVNKGYEGQLPYERTAIPARRTVKTGNAIQNIQSDQDSTLLF